MGSARDRAGIARYGINVENAIGVTVYELRKIAKRLFYLPRPAGPLAGVWAWRDETWVKRAGFALMAGLAAHDEAASDGAFVRLLPLIERGAFDERNFVKKAVNWALRNIGKRSPSLNAKAVACAGRLVAAANERAGAERGGDPAVRAARWIGTDALRELRSEKVRARLGR